MGNLYDSNGNLRGHIYEGDDRSGPILFAIILIGGVGWWIWHTLNHWQTLPLPYKYIAGYYYYLIAVPLKQFPLIWEWGTQLTSYPNLNLLLGGGAVFVYGFFGLPILIMIFAAIFTSLKIQKHWQVILFGPASLGFVWFLYSSAASWLFSK